MRIDKWLFGVGFLGLFVVWLEQGFLWFSPAVGFFAACVGLSGIWDVGLF